MDRLIEGHKQFLAEVFPAAAVIFICCGTAGAGVAVHYLLGFAVLPDLILGTGPGDLFITRNAGNVVPVTSQDVDGCTATIEYAVDVLQVKHAILCGHSDCGAMKAALNRKGLESCPRRALANHVEAAFSHRQPVNPADGESAELASLIRGNVVAQLKNLRAQPSVARAMVEGRLHRAWLVLRHSDRAD